MSHVARALVVLLPLAVACSAADPVTSVPSCPGGLGTDEEIAGTPRADADAELLALSLGDRVTADPETYARVVVDLAAIRASAPEIAHLSVRRDAQSIDVYLTDGTPLRTGYHDWDCLNAHYGLVAIGAGQPSPTGFNYASIGLKGRYATDLIACAYARLPHMVHAEPQSTSDGPNIYAFADGTTFHYVFDDASGDCILGCSKRVASHFVTDAKGTVTRLETYDSTLIATPPEWFLRARPVARACAP